VAGRRRTFVEQIPGLTTPHAGTARHCGRR
jgi:hypothetical protein